MIFNKNNFLLIDRTPDSNLPFCCDTVSYGKCEKDKNLLTLRSPEEYSTFFLDAQVEEKSRDSDSVVIYIDNPIERHYKKFNQKYRELYYSLEISSSDSSFDSQMLYHKWETNRISFLKPKNIVINSLVLNIVPKSDMKVRSIEARFMTTLTYEIKTKNSNVFDIYIPNLSYKYISLLRLKGDYVKIDSNNVLIWNNEKFKKVRSRD